MSEHRISSPAATGGAGIFFEQHVAAYWLAQLLVRSRSPILHHCSVVEVHLQTERLGWHTDDFLIVGLDSAGNQRRLAGQVKRTLTISKADKQCRKAIEGFWKDFKKGNPYSSATDCFALVVQRGAKNLLDHFVRLLECARTASHEADFAHRLKTPGFVSQQAVSYCSTLCTIVGDIEGKDVTSEAIWPFLSTLYVLNLDLHTPTRQMEAHVKTLLEHQYADSGTSGTLESADVTWNELLELATKGMENARGFTREQLPRSLKQCYSTFGTLEEKSLRALKNHSDIVLNGIRSKIGNDFHLPRPSLVHEILGCLESTQVVLVSGPPGTGKSVVAKDAIGILSKSYFVFSFRAEEFAQPHLDATLQNSQIPVSTTELTTILANQDRKILLIESVERLLEKSTRDAFSDLLGLVASDRALRIVLTCRDYSVGLVRSSILAPTGIEHSVVSIPPLNGGELAKIEAALPALARLLANPKSRQILGNPYFLDMVLKIPWMADQSLPESEPDFRTVLWRHIVRVDDRPAAGMPRRREDVFQRIAVQRARALTAYIPCAGLDPAVVGGLRHDSLIVSPDQDQSEFLIAPAHDVLEDWAILHWIEERYIENEGAFHALSEAIGSHPAIRRAYRQWVAELIDCDLAAADRLFDATIADSDAVSQFRDDTLVSFLRAPSSPVFLERHVGVLLADDRKLLKRLIHLLRMACVTAAKWMPDSGEHKGSLFNVPDGAAWVAILRMVHAHIGAFTASEQPLLLGLIRDWACGVNWAHPYPDGAEAVASIAHRLLPELDTYQSEDSRRQVLSVIAKIPTADTARFESLLSSGIDAGRQDNTGDAFREITFSGFDGMYAARDLPDAVVSAALKYLICTEADLQRHSYYSSHDLEIHFGLNERLSLQFSPASAYQGPWFHLLNYHPGKGLEFLIKIFNHSVDWYAHPRIPDRLEPPFEILLVFPDGAVQKQWCSPRLWNLYRGTSVGPDVLQSMLMALERWLLNLAEERPDQLEPILLKILRRSDSVALTSVVAGVATAFPHISGEALLVLLSSPACIRLDLERAVAESPATLTGFSLHCAEGKFYEMDRKEMNDLPHRQYHLESAMVNLQLGPLAGRVHEILDGHRDALPHASEQTDDDRFWRLSMHRMDLRQYSVDVVSTGGNSATEESSTGSASSGVLLNLKDPEPDIKAMVDERSANIDVANAGMNLLMWSLHIFERRGDGVYDPKEWRRRLSQAQSSVGVNAGDSDIDLCRGAPAIVSAVCVREHWQEMSGSEKNWCVEVVCSEIARDAVVWDRFYRSQLNSMSADRPCATVIALLVGEPLSATHQSLVRSALANALTHPVDEVKQYAVRGVADYLCSRDPTLAMRCVQALATEAVLIEQARAGKLNPYDQRRPIDDCSAEAAVAVRERFWSGGIADDTYQKLDIGKGLGARANILILTILDQMPTDPTAIDAFKRSAYTLVGWWDSDDRQRDRDCERRPERNYQVEFKISELLTNFAMHTSDDAVGVVLQPLLDAIDRHPRGVYWVIRKLISIEDRWPNTPRFWAVWRLFSERIRRAVWLSRLNDPTQPAGRDLLLAVFLGANWREDVRHWKSLEEGHADNVHALFRDLPPSSIVLNTYVRFLYYIGEQSFPYAFVRVADRLRSGDIRQMLENVDTVFMLEVLLLRYVYGRPRELKRERLIRENVLFLLDELVEQGSSRAFLMRDDFVTPISPA